VSSARALGCAGLLLALATVCGALGAHALRAHLTATQLQLWETGVSFQFFHSLGLLGVGLTMRSVDDGLLRLVAALLLAGVVLFSGSLYALALGAPRVVGVLPPFGGLAWIAGWLMFAWALWRQPRR
jgi:uncharacterized membrane protein YgdD (TMEM256/DUF423 family)